MTRIRAVFFDAVGTLIHPEPAAPLVYAEVGQRFGSRYSAEAMRPRFARACANQDALDRHNAWITSEDRESERWRAIVAEVLDDVGDPAACFDVLYQHFAQAQAWCCTAGLETLFADLAARGLLLGLASNFDARLLALAQALEPLRPLCRHVVVSAQVGARKPAPAFFQALCRRTGLPPDSLLHVGDDPDNDGAAAAAGLTAVLYDPRGQHKRWTGARVALLSEIARFIA